MVVDLFEHIITTCLLHFTRAVLHVIIKVSLVNTSVGIPQSARPMLLVVAKLSLICLALLKFSFVYLFIAILDFATTMGIALLESSDIQTSASTLHCTHAMLTVVFPFSFVFLPVGILHFALAMMHTVHKFSFIYCLIITSILVGAPAMHFVALPFSVVNSSSIPLHFALAMPVVILPFSLVYISIGPRVCAIFITSQFICPPARRQRRNQFIFICSLRYWRRRRKNQLSSSAAFPNGDPPYNDNDETGASSSGDIPNGRPSHSDNKKTFAGAETDIFEPFSLRRRRRFTASFFN
mmetsp:Transcript_39882/g.71882  ORF Transcript_39882/g.71882 Transcript_39882/m.71882 type:complete len:295 (-) Transcript_39882:595-1479(-)